MNESMDNKKEHYLWKICLPYSPNSIFSLDSMLKESLLQELLKVNDSIYTSKLYQSLRTFCLFYNI